MVVRVLCVLMLGALLAGCDRCGDFWPWHGNSQSCRADPPVQPTPPPIY